MARAGRSVATAMVTARLPVEAAGQAMQVYASPASTVGFTNDGEGIKVVVTLTLAAALQAMAMCALIAVALVGGGYRACQVKASRQRAHAGQEPGRAPRRAKKAFCDAGVQGPVHYTGDRYIHDSQGFRRAWEIERTPATKHHPE